VTSPPYFGLRDYGTARWDGGSDQCDHLGPPMRTNNKPSDGRATFHGGKSRATEPMGRECDRCGARRVDSQIGLEASPAEYVDTMVQVFRDVRRVLREDGTLWLNLGDSYAGSWGAQSRGPAGVEVSAVSAAQVAAAPKLTRTGSLERTPGLKPKDLMGIPWRVAFALQADGWWLRSDIVWSKPNPMPESVTDRPTKAHEYLFLLAKGERYFYDAAAIAEPAARAGEVVRPYAPDARSRMVGDTANDRRTAKWLADGMTVASARNRRSVWTVATQPFPEAHFATFPEALVEPCILAGSRPGDLVLDPFTGSGTVGKVAYRHGRRFVGAELNPSYVEMAKRRILGPLFASVAP
jgi:DNA modification methylase